MGHLSIYDILKQALIKSLLISSFIAFVSIFLYSVYHQKQINTQVEQTISSQINSKNADLVTAFMLGNHEGLEAIIENSFQNRPIKCWVIVYPNNPKDFNKCSAAKIDDLKKISITSGGLNVGDLYYELVDTFDSDVLIFRSVLIFFSIVFSISVTSLIIVTKIRRQILMPLVLVKNSIKEGFPAQNIGNCAEIVQLNEEIIKFRLIAAKNEELQKHSAIARTTQTIAHDLKSPINVINLTLNCVSWTEFLQRKAITNSAMLRLQGMVDSFKNADLESVVKPNWGAISWDGIINEMRAIADEKGVILHADEIIKDQTYLDIPKIERVVMNLLRNAIECGAGNVWLVCFKNGMDFAIEIIDDGPGVPEDFVPHLFDRGKTINKKDGTGLGLSFVKQTANGHGGEVKYERKNNRSVFSVTLPGAVKDEPEIVRSTHEMVDTQVLQQQDQSALKNEEPFVENKQKAIFSKVTICLVDKQLEVRVIDAIAKEYPTVSICDSLDGSAFAWTNKRDVIKAAIGGKVPIAIISDKDTFESIVQIISHKLRHFI